MSHNKSEFDPTLLETFLIYLMHQVDDFLGSWARTQGDRQPTIAFLIKAKLL